MVTRKDVGRHVTDGVRVGVLRALDLKWVDPASPPYERRIIPQAWVVFDGREQQIHAAEIERA